MIAVRFYSKTELLKTLAPYKCRCIETLADGTEVWETGWGVHFTLTPEPPPYDDGDENRYDWWQVNQLIAMIIGPTLPPGFGGGGNGKPH